MKRSLTKTTMPYYDAHQAVYRAKLSGALVQQPCEVCGEIETVAHHDSYDDPLKIRWLCQKHHSEFHRNNPPPESSEPVDTWLQVRIDIETKRQLEILAEHEERTMSGEVRWLINKGFGEMQKGGSK